MDNKLLLIILDGVPWRNWSRLFGNLEGWVADGTAQKWKMTSVLPSISASCYASIHTGVTPQEHGCTGNGNVFRIKQPDIFSEIRKAGGKTGAVAHSFWSEFFNRHPFDYVRDIEYDEPESNTINHGRVPQHDRLWRGQPDDAIRCGPVRDAHQPLPQTQP